MPTTWTSNGMETVKYVQKKPYGTCVGNLKVHCPRLMPNIEMDVPKYKTVALNKKLFKNDDDCAITIPNQIKTQNFFTAEKPRSPGYNLQEYDFGAEMSLEPVDKFLLKGRLTVTIDNSTFH